MLSERIAWAMGQEGVSLHLTQPQRSSTICQSIRRSKTTPMRWWGALHTHLASRFPPPPPCPRLLHMVVPWKRCVCVCFDFETNDDTRYELLMMIDIFGRGVKLIRRNCILWWWWYDGAKCRVGLARFRLWRYGHLIYKRSLLRCGCGLIVIFIMYVWFRSTEER